MKRKIAETPDERPIICVLMILGILSYISAFVVTDLRIEPSPVFDVTTVAGFICGLIALPLGLKLGNIELCPIRNPAYSPDKIAI